ncbi:unnamed protein product [Prorocentrum cordatum]|uniref:Uncharacterized protein n=1 Tax=Prorocentrum cordatum TaxID=2364126 RepID=A0ABN9RKV7_9DINO|nr:unnamed protein product [Polarella glacialis]
MKVKVVKVPPWERDAPDDNEDIRASKRRFREKLGKQAAADSTKQVAWGQRSGSHGVRRRRRPQVHAWPRQAAPDGVVGRVLCPGCPETAPAPPCPGGARQH